jgi:hypothetical protein
MKEVADIIAADSTDEWEMGKYTGRRTSPTRDEIAQLAFSLYESRCRQDISINALLNRNGPKLTHFSV